MQSLVLLSALYRSRQNFALSHRTKGNVEVVNITKFFCEMLPDAYCRVIMQQVSSFWIGSINTSVVNISMNCFPYIPSAVNEQGQFNKTFTRVIYKCSHCFRV